MLDTHKAYRSLTNDNFSFLLKLLGSLHIILSCSYVQHAVVHATMPKCSDIQFIISFSVKNLLLFDQ